LNFDQISLSFGNFFFGIGVEIVKLVAGILFGLGKSVGILGGDGDQIVFNRHGGKQRLGGEVILSG